MTDLEDCAPEAPALAVKLGVAVCDCAEAGMSLDDIMEVVESAFETWFKIA